MSTGQGEQAEVPTCYRHPGRETYVSCVRCGRYACPDCMRSASVGQQCVDCVGQGAQASRSARTVFGGRPAAGAVFGLFGAWFVVSRRLRLDTRGIAMLIAINLAFSFFYHNTIAWQDHIGGLLTGALLTAAYAYAPRRYRAATQALATAAVVAALLIAIAVRTGQLTAVG